MAREAADRGIISCDNRGYMPCLGDYSSEFGYPTSLFQKAACYYGDGRYAFMEPRDMIDFRVAPLDELYYQLPKHDPEGARVCAILPPNISYGKTFDKISFRTGFDPADQYLLFDGVGGGSHSYEDMNSVNAVTVVRDGQG